MKRIEFVLCLFFISTVSFAQKEIAPTKNSGCLYLGLGCISQMILFLK